MPFYYVFSATESSFIQTDMPTAGAIINALAPLQNNYAQWVGPAPRITRTVDAFTGVQYAPVSYTRGFHTTFAWLMAINDPSQTSADAAAQQAATAIKAAIDAMSNSNWSDVTVTPYSQNANGPLSWWQNGTASVTQTKDTPLTGAATFAADDNPIGPNTAAARPPTLGEQTVGLGNVVGGTVGGAVGGALQPVEKVSFPLLTIVAIGVGAVALWTFWPQIAAMRARSAARSKSRPSDFSS